MLAMDDLADIEPYDRAKSAIVASLVDTGSVPCGKPCSARMSRRNFSPSSLLI